MSLAETGQSADLFHSFNKIPAPQVIIVPRVGHDFNDRPGPGVTVDVVDVRASAWMARSHVAVG